MGALFKKTNKIKRIIEATIIPLILINAFLGFEIFLILSPLYRRFKIPHTIKGRMIDYTKDQLRINKNSVHNLDIYMGHYLIG